MTRRQLARDLQQLAAIVRAIEALGPDATETQLWTADKIVEQSLHAVERDTIRDAQEQSHAD